MHKGIPFKDILRLKMSLTLKMTHKTVCKCLSKPNWTKKVSHGLQKFQKWLFCIFYLVLVCICCRMPIPCKRQSIYAAQMVWIWKHPQNSIKGNAHSTETWVKGKKVFLIARTTSYFEICLCYLKYTRQMLANTWGVIEN